MTQKKSDILKNIMINLGVLFILVGATVTQSTMTFILIGIVLLAIQTFEFTGVQPKKLIIAEIMLATTLAAGAVNQLVTAGGSRTHQVFLVVLLLGALLIVVEATRKYADLEA